MKRKVMRISESTYVVSLPLKWVREEGIEKGQDLEMARQGKDILIRIGKEADKQEKRYSADIGKNMLAGDKLVVSLYRQGYSQMEISYSAPDFAKRLPAVLSENLMGFAILSHKDNKALIRELYRSEDARLDSMLKRMVFMIIDMAKDIEADIRDRRYKDLENMDARDENVNQFMNYCIRSLSSGGGPGDAGDPKNYAMYYLVRSLESLSDSYKHLAANHSMARLPGDQVLIGILGKANHLLEDIYEANYSFSLDKIERILSEADALGERINKEMGSAHNRSLILDYAQLLQIASKLKALCTPITELNL